MEKICESMPYINEIFENLSEIESSVLREILEVLREAKAVILIAEGRSRSALDIGFQGIKKTVITPNDIDLPARTLPESFPMLEQQFEKIVMIVNSSSGETTTPKEYVKEMQEYIEKTGSKGFKIITVTSRLDSSVAKVKDKECGLVLELKGPKSQARNAEEAKVFGTLNDIFELASMLLFHRIKEAVNNQEEPSEIPKKIEKDGREIGKTIDEFTRSERYRILLRQMTGRGDVTVVGQGPAEKASWMLAIRLNHIKMVFGERAYVAGPFTIRPRLGDISIAISWSGITEPVLEWVKNYNAAGAYTFAFGGKESPLTGITNQSFIISSEPLDFYWQVSFLISVLAPGLIGEFNRQGFEIPSMFLRYYHSVTE